MRTYPAHFLPGNKVAYRTPKSGFSVAYIFQYKRISESEKTCICWGCHKEKKCRTTMVKGNLFVSNPEALGHRCKPLKWSEIDKKKGKKQNFKSKEAVHPEDAAQAEETTDAPPSPQPVLLSVPCSEVDPLDAEINRQDQEDLQREKNGLPLLVDEVRTPDFLEVFRLLQYQKKNSKK